MGKLVLDLQVPSKYDRQTITDLVRQLCNQINSLSEGAVAARYQATTSLPGSTAQQYAVSDIVWDKNATQAGGTVTGNVRIGWICTSPGTGAAAIFQPIYTQTTAVGASSGISSFTNNNAANGTISGGALNINYVGLSGAFSAYLSADQTGLTGGANNKVKCDTVVSDPDSTYDHTTNFRHTPKVAGTYYYVSVATAGTEASDGPQNYLYKNGSELIIGQYIVDAIIFNGQQVIVNGGIAMNGTTDYVETFCYLPATKTSIGGMASGHIRTMFAGWRISA